MERQDEVVRGSKHYVREFVSNPYGDSVDWYRISSQVIIRDGKQVPYVPLEKRDPEKHKWEFIYLRRNGKKRIPPGQLGVLIQDEELVRKLESQFEREEKQREAEAQTFALAREEARNPSPPAESDSESESAEAESQPNKSWQRHTRKPSEGQRVEHTKYGVRVWTLDGKTWWDICVNESDTYPGGTAVRLTLPPPRKDGKRWNMGIFDLEMMEAIRREFARGIQPKAVITPKAVYTAKAKKKAV